MYSNEVLHLSMCRRYCAASAARTAVFGFPMKGNILAVQVTLTPEILQAVTILELKSGKVVLRYHPNKTHKAILLANSERTTVICSNAYMESAYEKHSNLNRGDLFEIMAAKVWGGIRPSNRATVFTACGDFNANGEEFQVKYDKATITTEETLLNLGL
jgi:hypothetical protein